MNNAVNNTIEANWDMGIKNKTSLKVGYETQGPKPELSPEPGYLNFRYFQN